MDRILVVQFLHPGGEHRPDENGWVRWNNGPHKRKFVECRGKYLSTAKDQTSTDSRIHFWTEWEAESRLIRKLPARTIGSPQFLFEPLLRAKATYADLCNTDPSVFGGFHYCICQQRGQLKQLDRGSVILFGSRFRHRFVLDTVFVVDRWEEYCPGDHSNLSTTPEYWAVGLAPIFDDAVRIRCQGEQTNHERYRLYHGATFENQVAGMFSFFPCIRAEQSKGFPRPTIRLDGVVGNNLAQNYRLSKHINLASAAGYWREVVRQAVHQGLALGVAAEMPQMGPPG